MGRDEALLELRVVPTLRFYRWERPTLSLGYFQEAARLPLEAIRARGGEVVRRPTGGKAILHEEELTYALCAPELGALAGGPAAAMRTIHRALAEALGKQAAAPITPRGSARLASDRPDSPWCFEDSSPLDLTLGKRKLLGSAARRRRGWILFHGSLVLHAPRETPGVAELGFPPQLPPLVSALGNTLGIDFRPGNWTEAELQRAAELAQERYRSDTHTLRR